MDDQEQDTNAYIHNRTNQILRDRIKYGMYGGEGYGTHKGALKGWKTRREHTGMGYGTHKGALKGWKTRHAHMGMGAYGGIPVGGRRRVAKRKVAGSKVGGRRRVAKKAGVRVGGRRKSRKGGRHLGYGQMDEDEDEDENEEYREYMATVGRLAKPQRKPGRRGSGVSSRTQMLGEMLGGRVRANAKRKRYGGSKSSARHSPWIKFVKHFAKENNIPYKIALEEAGPYYRGEV
jgi:hypothetical protein